MSEELEITKEKIRRLEEGLADCGEAQNAVRKAFPEAFEEIGEWIDITGDIVWVTENYTNAPFPYLLYGIYLNGDRMGYINKEGFQICFGYERKYKVEQNGQAFRFLKWESKW